MWLVGGLRFGSWFKLSSFLAAHGVEEHGTQQRVLVESQRLG